MAQRVIVTCDKCGKEVENSNHWNLMSSGPHYFQCALDLCNDCAKVFVDDVVQLLNDTNADISMNSYHLQNDIDMPTDETEVPEDAEEEA